MLTPGTRIEAFGHPAAPGFPAVPAERGTIIRPRNKRQQPRGEGWHIVRFDGCEPVQMHETGFRVLDARP